MPLGQGRDQVELVRIALDAGQRRLDRLARLRAHAQRVLVGGQLDDLLDRRPIWRASSVIGLPGM
jgi:hypothetical protein